MTKRLEDFRLNNTDESTVLNYFDELEIHPISVQVEDKDSEAIFSTMIKHVGRPHNFGPTPEKLAALRLQEEERLVSFLRIRN